MMSREQADAAADAVLGAARARQARAAGRHGSNRSRVSALRAGWALAGLLAGAAFDWASPGTTHGSLIGVAAGALVGRWHAGRTHTF